MKKIVVASKNPVKIQCALDGFIEMFPSDEFEVTGVSVESGVSNQPKSDSETYMGALNRALNACRVISEADFWVGIEGGIQVVENEMMAFAWVVIRSSEQFGKARTGTFFLPNPVVNLILSGKELGEADDIIFNRRNSKQQNGAIGILTGDVLNRASFYKPAVIMALIPFKNADIYK